MEWSRRGEALAEQNANATYEIANGITNTVEDQPNPAAHWYVLWTHSNCERLVYEQLRALGFEVLLPMIGQWARRRGLRYLGRVPMFPGYLFLHHPIDKLSYLQVCKVRGLVRILGEQWDRLAAVPDREIAAIQTLIQTDLPALPHPYLHEGQRVRVLRGPLANAEGILLKSEPENGLLVLSIEMLRRSVAVEIDCTHVRPV
jgi:transcriptional antiterminator NusG